MDTKDDRPELLHESYVAAMRDIQKHNKEVYNTIYDRSSGAADYLDEGPTPVVYSPEYLAQRAAQKSARRDAMYADGRAGFADLARGVKEVAGKLRYDLIPPSLELELAKVVTAGAKKYGDRNWEKGIPTDECIGAMKRHIARFQLGQELSPHDGAHEMAHVAFWCMVLIEQAGIDQSEFMQS